MLAEEKEGSDKTVLMSHLFFDLIGIVNLKLINKKINIMAWTKLNSWWSKLNLSVVQGFDLNYVGVVIESYA